MLTIGNKHLRKRYIYPNNVVDVYTGHNHIWPYITDVIASPWVVSLSASPTIVPASGGIVTLTYSAERTVTTTWVHYDGTSSNYYTTYETETAVASVTSTIGSISGNELTIPENPSTTSRDIEVTATYGGSSKTVIITQEAAGGSEPNVPDWSDWNLAIYRNGDDPQQWYVDSSAQTITFTIKCFRRDENGIEDDEYYPTDTTNAFDINISCTNGGTTSHSLINYNDLSNTTLTVTIPAFDENSDAYNPTTGVCSYYLNVDSDTTNHGGMPYMQDSVTIIQSAPV